MQSGADREALVTQLLRPGPLRDQWQFCEPSAKPLFELIELDHLEPPPPPPRSPPRPAPAAKAPSRAAAALEPGDDSDDDSDGTPAGGGPRRRASRRHGGGARGERSSDESDCPSDPEELADRTVELESRLARTRAAYGPADERTLAVVFKLLDALVAQYQLNRMDELFAEFQPICQEARGRWHLRCIQSQAFCCFKQYRFAQALALFKEQERLMGASAPLCENIGHVCSSLSDYDQAERYFRLATRLLPPSAGNSKNAGGVYLGLGLLLDRRGKPTEALPVLQQALELYEASCFDAAGRFAESSLVAKAHMSVANCHERLGALDDAERHMRDAVAIFARTVGEASPLLAGALGSLGKVRHKQGALADAAAQLSRALELEVGKDAFHLRTVWELVEAIKKVSEDQLMHKPGGYKPADVPATFGPHGPALARAVARMGAHGSDRADPDTASVLRKAAGEVLLLGGHTQEALVQLRAAADMFRGFTHCDCSTLIKSCEDYIAVALERLRPA